MPSGRGPLSVSPSSIRLAGTSALFAGAVGPATLTYSATELAVVVGAAGALVVGASVVGGVVGGSVVGSVGGSVATTVVAASVVAGAVVLVDAVACAEVLAATSVAPLPPDSRLSLLQAATASTSTAQTGTI